jgi:broad specificity phosphatase PhoE
VLHRRHLNFAFLLALLLSTTASSQQRAVAARSTLRIYLARHGQTDWNLQGRTQGGIDIELNATGREQAQLLKMRVSGIPLDAVYSSTLRRSRETAEIVHRNIPLTSLPGLSERRFGKFEGGPTSDPDLQRRRWIPDDALDGGESLNALRERVSTTLDTIRKKHASGSILIVGHDYMNRMLLSVLVGLTVEQMQQFDQANDELYLIELEAGNPPRLWKLITQSNIKDL